MFKFVVLASVASFVAATYDHGATSYSFVSKHDDHKEGGYGGYPSALLAGGALYAGGSDYEGGLDNGHVSYADHYAHPKYKFDYGVKDAHTGDHKDAWETRDGDVVKGGYSLDEPDGTKRVVEYTSDKHNGFKAIVKKIGHAHHPQAFGHSGLAFGLAGNYGGHGGHGGASSYASVSQYHY